ncbi:MAG: hypothetical protein NTX50_29185 [Candidatus Sumerlaeota bacterium]|nr:hypothetical protein [Candidatus Sumerlaeota bacterium]
MKSKKAFDCVEMKRRIQEQIYKEAHNLSGKELIAYFHRRIARSEFADFLELGAGASVPRSRPVPRPALKHTGNNRVGHVRVV